MLSHDSCMTLYSLDGSDPFVANDAKSSWMSRTALYYAIALAVILLLTTWTGAAQAQFMYDPCSRPCPIPCTPAPQVCYRTIPVTEYQDVQQTVQCPEYYTDVEERDVTEYRRVCSTRAVQIPTVSYQRVVEYRTVQRDCGRWANYVECRPKMAPCEYDNRPDLLGALNRTAYSVRMAFTPDQVNRRVWQPNVMTSQVPVTRQIAVRGTRTVNYQVSEVQPFTTRKQVAVTKMRMVAKNVTYRKPVTVMKTVPVGSAIALGPRPQTVQQSTNRAGVTAQADIQPAPANENLGERAAINPRSSSNSTRGATDSNERRPTTPANNRSGDFTDDSEDRINGGRGRRDQGSSNDRIRIVPRGSVDGGIAQTERPQGEWVAARKSIRPIGQWVAARKRSSDDSSIASNRTIDGPSLEPIVLARRD